MPHTFEYPVMRYRVIDGDSVKLIATMVQHISDSERSTDGD